MRKCAKCGKEFSGEFSFCPYCGQKLEESKANELDSYNVKDDIKQDNKSRVVALCIVSTVLVCLVGICMILNNTTDIDIFSEMKQKETAVVTEESTEPQTEPDYTQEALDILNSTSYMDSIDPAYVDYGLCSDITFGQLVASMFENPQIEVTPRVAVDDIILGYDVTVSGVYRDTPGGYYINEGKAYISIGTSPLRCSIDGDHYFKSAAANYAFTVTGYYG